MRACIVTLTTTKNKPRQTNNKDIGRLQATTATDTSAQQSNQNINNPNARASNQVACTNTRARLLNTK